MIVGVQKQEEEQLCHESGSVQFNELSTKAAAAAKQWML